jgi:DNA (cytosine-5)-methyltransferase 1
MKFWEYLNETLRPTETETTTVLDLFAGAGGLSLGFEAAGYKTIGYEMDKAACETYNKNLSGVCHEVKLSAGFEYPEADIVIGGRPASRSVFGVTKKARLIRETVSPFLLKQSDNYNRRYSFLKMSGGCYTQIKIILKRCWKN